MPITSDFELAASAPDDALAQAVRDPMSSPISQIAALSELRSRQQLRQEAAAAQGAQPGTVADKILAPIGYKDGGMVRGYKHGGIVQHFKDGSKGKPVSIIPDSYVKRIEAYEGQNNPNSKNPFSSASGLYQMIDSTRAYLDKRYGLDPRDRSPETERKRMNFYTQETIDQLERNNIPVTGGTMYGGHLMGQRGVTDFYKAYQSNPDMRVEDFFSPEVIRVNPDIFNPKGGKKRETLAEVMTKLDQVGGGKTITPRSAEDMNLGAALQVAKRADRGDTGPGYEDAGLGGALALANMLEQTKTAPKPAPTPKPDYMAEDPTLAKLYAAIGARSREPAQADSGEDMQTIEEMNNQVRRRLAQFRQQQPMYGGGGEAAGFRNGGIVQHFRDGSEGPVYGDGRLVIDLPYDKTPRAIIGQPMPVDPFLADLNYALESGGAFGTSPTGIPLGSIPEQNPLSLMPNPFLRDMPPARTREEYDNAMYDALQGKSAQAEYIPDAYAPDGPMPTKSAPNPNGFSFGRDIANWSVENLMRPGVEGMTGPLGEFAGVRDTPGIVGIPYNMYAIGREGVGRMLRAGQAGLGTALTGTGALIDLMFGTGPGAREWAMSEPEEPAQKKTAKPAAPPAKAPPTTKLAPTGAPVSGTGASPAGNAPQVRGTGISAGIKSEPPPPPQNTPGSPYGPAEQFVRELYKEDAARQERLARREEEAKRMARIQAGLAIASGDSQYFAKNLARAIPVISDYQKTRAGLDTEADEFERQFRERLIGARGIDIQQAELMKRTQAQNDAEVKKAEIEAASKLQELMREGALTERAAFEKIYEYYTKPNPLTGELPPVPAQYKDNRDAYIVELTQKTIRSLTPIPLQTTTKKPAAGG